MGKMFPTIVRVDEVVGEDDNDASDELVLEEDKGWMGGAEEERWWWVRSAVVMLEVGEEERDNVAKTDAEGGVPVPREAA